MYVKNKFNVIILCNRSLTYITFRIMKTMRNYFRLKLGIFLNKSVFFFKWAFSIYGVSSSRPWNALQFSGQFVFSVVEMT